MLHRLQLLFLFITQLMIINNIKYHLSLNYLCDKEIFDICNENEKDIKNICYSI